MPSVDGNPLLTPRRDEFLIKLRDRHCFNLCGAAQTANRPVPEISGAGRFALIVELISRYVNTADLP
ncbi:hypothetical protein KGQ19_05300 [Catenulispora sp. NL8]|uniref:Uncharacterized protein n=1 Tax=Catenulispora pinistramenti TaxID=2705254 RepID=A0ABS5KKJ1_9ACTN|nr:hypothetical protein [Catenulispora pinistramenti]MBS2546276.1 hypothetical protein [Catenulispora pinistramenti]